MLASPLEFKSILPDRTDWKHTAEVQTSALPGSDLAWNKLFSPSVPQFPLYTQDTNNAYLVGVKINGFADGGDYSEVFARVTSVLTQPCGAGRFKNKKNIGSLLSVRLGKGKVSSLL